MTRIYTFGYTGSKPEDLAAFAQATGALVADIRYSAWSRVPHWTQPALQHLLYPNYIYLHEFGNENYRGGLVKLHKPEEGLERVRAIVAKQPIILLCACKDPYTCHRWIVARYLTKELGLEMEHLPTKFEQWEGHHA